MRLTFKEFLCLLAVLCFLMLGVTKDSRADDKPGLIEVYQARGEVSAGMAAGIAEFVEKTNDNEKVKGVLLVVDSPGGGVIASANIYSELSKLKVPVVVWCDNLCASGGMYLAMAPSVKWIAVRSDATISGSIGVIMHVQRYHRLLNEKLKVDSETYKSGKLKDYGNPNRPPEDGEAAQLQGEVKMLAERFYAVVKAGRGDKVKDWPAVKDAGVFFGSDGVKVGLVDAVMTYEQAVEKAKELSGNKANHTRDELRKISKQASAGTEHEYGYEPRAPRETWETELFSQLKMWGQVMREVRAGESVRVEYRLPWALE